MTLPAVCHCLTGCTLLSVACDAENLRLLKDCAESGVNLIPTLQSLLTARMREKGATVQNLSAEGGAAGAVS